MKEFSTAFLGCQDAMGREFVNMLVLKYLAEQTMVLYSWYYGMELAQQLPLHVCII